MNYSGTANLEAMLGAVNYNKFLLDLLLRYAKVNDQILDFGAGIGTFASHLSRHGFSVCCIEPDAKQSAVISGAGIRVYSDLSHVEDESLDYIYSMNVLEHIQDDISSLKYLCQKLKPGGRLLIYVPAFQILYSSMDRKVGHHRRYRRASLVDVVKKSGFKIVKSRYADCIGFFATVLYKIIADDSGAINDRALKIYDQMIFPVSRIFDRWLGFFIGKNVFVLAVKSA